MEIDIMEIARTLKNVEIKCAVRGCECCEYKYYSDRVGMCSATAIVDELKKQRYVKLAENEIVITKEYYDELKSRPDRAIHIDITKDLEKEFRVELEQVRKETAREVLSIIFNEHYIGEWDIGDLGDPNKKIVEYAINGEDLKKLAEKNGVEVE